jgi:hypothetical protein
MSGRAIRDMYVRASTICWNLVFSVMVQHRLIYHVRSLEAMMRVQ